MKKHSGYIPVDSGFPFRGLASTLPGTYTPSGLAIDLLNVTVRDGVIRRRPGYLKIGQTLDGIVLDIQEFAKVGNSDALVIFTSLAQYVYDLGTDLFLDISQETVWSYDIDSVTLNSVTVGEDVLISSDNMTADQHFCIFGSASNDGNYKLTGTSGSTVLAFTPALVDITDSAGDILVVRREHISTATSSTRTLVFNTINLTGYISANDTIYIKNSTGNDGTYTVESIVFSTNTTIVVDQTLPSDVNDGYITHRVDRTYTDGDYLNSEGVTDLTNKRLLHTNGADAPIVWFGDVADDFDHFIRWTPRFTSLSQCKTIRVFKEHLFLGDITSAANEPSLIAWSDSGKFDEFVIGNSGSQTLYELTTGIQQLMTLGDRLIIFSRDALATSIFVGLPFVFAFETVIPTGTRLASARGITSINVGHIYGSEENFYLFDGSRGLRTLADVIRADYRSRRDYALIHQMNMLNDYAKKTLYIAVPTIDEKGAVYTLFYDAFDLRQRAWAKEEYAHPPRAFGFYASSFTYNWADNTQEQALAVTLGNDGAPPHIYWSDEIGVWGEEGEQADFPVRIHGDALGNVFMASEGVLSDAGTSTEGYFISGDITLPEEMLSTETRWGEFEFEAMGDTCVVELFGDHGSKLLHKESITMDGTMKHYRLPIDGMSRTIRAKFTFPAAFELRWMRFWGKSASPRE